MKHLKWRVFRSNWQLKRWDTQWCGGWLDTKNLTVNLLNRWGMVAQGTLALPEDSNVLLFDTSLLHHPKQTAQTSIVWPNGGLWWIEHRPRSDLTAHECGMTGWRLVCGPGVAGINNNVARHLNVKYWANVKISFFYLMDENVKVFSSHECVHLFFVTFNSNFYKCKDNTLQ